MIIQLTNNNYDDTSPQIHNGQVAWYGYDGSDYEIFLYDGVSTTQLTYNFDADLSPQIHNGNVTWQGMIGSDFEIFIYPYALALWDFIDDWFTTIQNGITSITTLVQDVIGRLDTVLAKLNSNLDVPVSSRASQTSVDDLNATVAEIESSVKKLDLQVHQHPTDRNTFYHIGVSARALIEKA